MRIVLVRHGESLVNKGEVAHGSVPDHVVCLTELGREQARSVGALLGEDFVRRALLYRSPYARTRETFDGIVSGAGVDLDAIRFYEDPRLREVDHGYEDIEAQQDLRKAHGWFYYRYKGGESPADCYDRVSGFVESLMRQVVRRQSMLPSSVLHPAPTPDVLVVTHGLTIRCFVMRFFHMSVEDFDGLANPRNCDMIEIASPVDAIDKPQFARGRWAVRGLRFRED